MHRTTFRYGGDVIPIDVKPGGGVDALYAPRRTVLDPILVDAAAAAGAEVCFGITVTDLARGRHDEVVGITAHAGSGDPFAVQARLVIGADGIRSTVAGLAGAARSAPAPAPAPSRTATGAASSSTATSGTSAPPPRPA